MKKEQTGQCSRVRVLRCAEGGSVCRTPRGEVWGEEVLLGTELLRAHKEPPLPPTGIPAELKGFVAQAGAKPGGKGPERCFA